MLKCSSLRFLFVHIMSIPCPSIPGVNGLTLHSDYEMKMKTYPIMKKAILFLFLVITTSILCKAQTSITGVLQTVDNVPVDFANVVLLAQTDSTFLSGTTSGSDGGFALAMPTQKNGACLIRITSIGYKTICQPVQVGDAGVFRMEDDAQMLGEVVVKASLPVTRLKGDAMVTNIDGTVLAKAGTAQDMLDYIPGVASQKGALEVLGRGTPVVYINGRLMRSSSELEQLSSEDILSVEVVNNPGARYDASVKAVIRIRTKKPVGEGFGFNTRTYGYYNKKWDLLQQVNLNYRKGGLDIFGMLYFNHEKYWEKFTLEQNTHLDDHWKQMFKANGTSESKNFIADFGMNYVFNENHSMGFKYRYDRYPESNSPSVYDTDITKNGMAYENSYTLSSFDSQGTENSLNLYYNGTIDQWNIDFNTDMLWEDNHNNQHVDETITPVGSSPTEQTVTTFNKVKNELYASKLVLSHPLFGGELAFGGEFSYTNRRTDYRNPEGVLDNDISKIEESNTAAFAEYNKEIGKVQIQAGLRYEHVAFDYYQEDVRQDEQSKKYDNLFPSISMSTSFGKVQMQLGYAQDISRPGFNSLRSHVYYANHYSYETGNPFLKPATAHNISLMGTYKWWKLTASYQKRKDDIISTTVPYSEDNPTIVLFKPINVPSYDVAFVQLSATPTIAWWSPRFTLSMQKQWYETETPQGIMSLRRPKFFFRWQNTMKLPAGFLFNLNGSWRSKFDNINTRANRASWRIDTSIQKNLFSDRLTLQLNGYDIFLSQRSSWTGYQGAMYSSRKESAPNSRAVTFTVRYRFNQAKDKYKGTGAGEAQKNRL